MKGKQNSDYINGNMITGNIEVNTSNLNIRIINSYENFKKGHPDKSIRIITGEKNENQIKQCEIYINKKKIPFNYYYNFPQKGIYEISYIFKEGLNSTNYIFADCREIISLDFSNFNTKKITNMSYML